jgi:cytidylate kinase
MTRTIIEEVAKEGNTIIVGRAGNLVLANHPRALHVFLLAPLEVRISRVMQAEGLSHNDAERRISGMDKLRTHYVHTFYHASWNDPTQYHLVVDSGVWGEDGTTDLLAWALDHTP